MVLRPQRILSLCSGAGAMKVCSRCKVARPVGAFMRCTAALDGLQSWCRNCAKVGQAESYQRHADKTKARVRANYHANPEPKRAAVKQWREENRDQFNATRRKKSRAHEEQRRRARKKDAFVEDVKVEVLAARDRNLCGLCGLPVNISARSVDHIVPLSNGGEHSYRNTQLAHRLCNTRRSDRGPAQTRLGLEA